VRGKFDFDVAGHYARPDIFQLVVDNGSKRAVSTLMTKATSRNRDIA
jgi:nitrilase